VPRATLMALLLLACAAAHAAEGEKEPEKKAARPSDTDPPRSCLDESITDELGQQLRPRGVQKRDFLKKRRFELIARGGLYAADLVSSSYIWGGAVNWFLSEDLGFEVTFDVSPIAVDLDEPLTEFGFDPRFDDGMGYLGMANVIWSPAHFKVKTEGGGIVHGDMHLVLGGGRLFHETAQGIAFDAGAIVELFMASWLSFRFELRDVVLIQEAVAETRLTNNIVALAGFGIWFPAF
jgi:outer membrane beta-barrel protein